MAVHPRHLSWWERWRGVGKYYDAETDYKQKIEEMRADWEASEARKADEKAGAWDEDADAEHEDSVWSSDVSTFFEKTRGTGTGNSPLLAPKEKEFVE